MTAFPMTAQLRDALNSVYATADADDLPPEVLAELLLGAAHALIAGCHSAKIAGEWLTTRAAEATAAAEHEGEQKH